MRLIQTPVKRSKLFEATLQKLGGKVLKLIAGVVRRYPTEELRRRDRALPELLRTLRELTTERGRRRRTRRQIVVRGRRFGCDRRNSFVVWDLGSHLSGSVSARTTPAEQRIGID